METVAADTFTDDAPRGAGGRARDPLPAAVLAGLTALDDRRSLRAIAATVGATAAVLAIAAIAWTPWVVVPAVFAVAALQHAVFVLVHDAAHHRLLADRRLNDATGRALASVAGISMCAYRVVHRLHHRHLYRDLDPDLALHGGYPRGRAYLLRRLGRDLAGLTAWKTYRYFLGAAASDGADRIADDTPASLREDARRDRRTVLAVQLGLPMAAFALGGATGLAKYAVLWVLPAATVLQAILRLRAIAEHGAPAGLDSPVAAARTHAGRTLVHRVLFPHHVGYHIEHHLYPAVPHYRLPELHAALRERGVLDGAQLSTFPATWRRVYADPSTAG